MRPIVHVVIGMVGAGISVAPVLAQPVPPPPPVVAPSPVAPVAVPQIPGSTLPAANVPQPDKTEPAQQEAPTPAPDLSKARTFTFGHSQLSVLFMPQQITRMKDAMIFYETTNNNAPPPPVPQAVQAEAPQVIEPPEYPVFFLSSIAYKTPADWTIWMAGHKITSRKNDTDLNVISVGPESVTFSWNPDYISAIRFRGKEGKFASVDAVKNKLSVVQSIRFSDDMSGGITFTLRQNQSFAVGYNSIFEGYMASPKLEALASSADAIGTQPVGGVPAAAMNMPPMSPPTGPNSALVRPNPTLPPGMQSPSMAPSVDPSAEMSPPPVSPDQPNMNP